MINYNNLPELNEIEPCLDAWLFESQKLYEKIIKLYIKAREEYTNSVIQYEKKYADEIEKMKAENQKVTIIKEIAQRNSHELYKNMLQSETLKKKYQYSIQAIESRINMLKYLMNRKYGNMS